MCRRDLTNRIKRDEVYALRRFTPVKRYALVGCLLVELQKTILAHLVPLPDPLLTKQRREANNAFEKQYRQLRWPSRRGLAQWLATGQPWRAPARPSATPLAT